MAPAARLHCTTAKQLTCDCVDAADTEAEAEREPLEVTLGDAPVLLLALGLGEVEALREAEGVPEGDEVAD